VEALSEAGVGHENKERGLFKVSGGRSFCRSWDVYGG